MLLCRVNENTLGMFLSVEKCRIYITLFYLHVINSMHYAVTSVCACFLYISKVIITQ